VSPPHNSSPAGWSPIEMPREGHRTCPRRGRGGTMGANTRQRVALIGHPLSLHHTSEGPLGPVRTSAPHPSPVQTGGVHPVLVRQHLSLEWDGTRERMCF
jgi:hypothetical protein